MKISKKAVICFCLSLCLVFSLAAPLSFLVSANAVYKSNLSEPVPTDNTKYFLIGNPNYTDFYLVAFYMSPVQADNAFSVRIGINSSGSYTYTCMVGGSTYPSNFTCIVYNGRTGKFISQVIGSWLREYSLGIALSS